MKLEQFIAQSGITAFAFAKSIGRDPGTISKILNGHQTPDAETMRRIIAATEGQVTPNDFFDIPNTTEAA